MKLKALFLDIDGTLTVSRESHSLSIVAVKALRKAVRKGIIVSLVSSAALPIVVGLSKYIGLNGFSIGETGCLIYSDSTGLVRLASRSAREIYLDLLKTFSDYVDDSWQNYFRLYDFELKLKSKYKNEAGRVVSMLRKYVDSKYTGFTVDYSGYALHIRPIEVDKKTAVLYVLEKLGLDPSEA
ncbi:MAG: HAD-IIB family hydrolase, partial [Desulfurococcaceae archaeon]